MQWCSDQNPNFELCDGSAGQWWAECQACHCTRLTAHFSRTIKPFWRLILSIFCFLNVSFLFQNSTLLCRQNIIFVDMSYFLKIAVLSSILSTKRLSMTALIYTTCNYSKTGLQSFKLDQKWGGAKGVMSLPPPPPPPDTYLMTLFYPLFYSLYLKKRILFWWKVRTIYCSLKKKIVSLFQ